MAHAIKIKRPAVGGLLDHLDREKSDGKTRSNENIDSTKTDENRVVAFSEKTNRSDFFLSKGVAKANTKIALDNAIKQHEADTGKCFRKDGVALVDWVITIPKDTPFEQTGDFFLVAFDFLVDRYGKENVVCGYVHMDETTPHMHVPVIPRVDGRLCAKEFLSRKELKSFHKAFQDYLEANGIQGKVLMDDGKKVEAALSGLSQDDYKRVRKHVDDTVTRNIQAKKALLNTRETELNTRETDLNTRETELNTREKALATREAKVAEREKKCSQSVLEASQKVEKAKEALDIATKANKAARDALGALEEIRDADEEYKAKRKAQKEEAARRVRAAQEMLDHAVSFSSSNAYDRDFQL